MKLRTRVALTTVGLLALGLLGTGLISAMAIHQGADKQGKSELAMATTQAQLVLAMVPTGPGVGPAPVAIALRAVLAKNTDVSFLAVITSDQRVLATAGPVPDAALAAAGAITRADGAAVPGSDGTVRAGGSRIETSDGHARIRVDPLRGGAVLVVGASTAGTDALVRSVLTTVLVVPLLALVATGLASWWLVRRGLRPLARIAAAADGIGLEGVSKRIEEPARLEEGRQVAQALNRMLGRIEAALRERDAANERLRRFVDDAAHELRTPIATVRGYAALFRRGAADHPDDLAALLARVESESERMGLLVDDLLALAAADPGCDGPLDHRREPVNLRALATQAAADTRVSAGRAVTVSAKTSAALDGDPAALRRVLDNLLSNALRHGPPDIPIEVRVREEAGQVTLSVADRGPGLEDEKRIFERFYRGAGPRSNGGGAGLGLAIVAAVAAAHDGKAWARNRAHGGAEVGVRLPLAAATVAR
jgi:two-component system OmpR family sensor kinase